MPNLICASCKRRPEEIDEYSLYADQGETPSEFVWTEEGTLDRATGLFLCTECYIKVGMPSQSQNVSTPGRAWTATRENLQALGITP